MGVELANMADTQVKSCGKTVVVGLGKTGVACARFLTERGEDVLVMDSSHEPSGLSALRKQVPNLKPILGQLDQDLLCGAARVIVSPGVPLYHPAIQAARNAGVEIIGDIELFARYAQAPVVAITGSNGKSTVTALLNEMAKAAGVDVRMGGNIGTPVLELLEQAEPALYVLELSSFQLESTSSLNAKAAVVLNLSQDHLDRYNSMDDYADAKYRIFHGDGVMVLNRDDERVAAWADAGRDCRWFGLEPPQADKEYGLMEAEGQLWLMRGQERLMAVDEMKLVGRHNFANALAALVLGDAVGLSMDGMLQALRTFAGLSHRCQWVAEQDGVNWYNDSKATNVGAAVAAISGMDDPVVLIAGGLGKGQDFAPLKDVVAKHCRAVVMMGRDAGQIQAALGDVVPVRMAANLGEVISVARELAQPGDVVLLSPACASFDMFSGYEDRGAQFVAAVQRGLA